MKKKKLAGTVACALFAAIICVAAPYAIPFTVPITAASFAIYVAGASLGIRRGTTAVLLYILIGAVGVPVFSGFQGGIGVLIGPTGGFIAGYIPCALICGAGAQLYEKRGGGRVGAVMANAAAMVVGTVVLYATGTAWYMFSAEVGLAGAVAVCVLPFIPGDVLKIAAVAAVAPTVRRRIVRLGV